MQAVRKELDRLCRGIARRVGTRRGARWHLALLVAACLLAVVHRMVVPLPVLTRLDGHAVLVVLVGLALLGLGPLLHVLAVRSAAPDPEQMARDLDDAHGWRDETSTAAVLHAGAAGQAVGRLLAAQTAGRLQGLVAQAAGQPIEGRFLLRFALAFLFAFFLLAPGIRPVWDDSGPGGDDPSWAGPTDGAIGARALESDWFFSTFVEDPLPVEALPDEETEGGGDR